MIIRDIFHERISDPIRSVTISGKSVLIRDNKYVRIIRSAPIRVIVKAENPLRNNPWVFASTDIRSAPHREFLTKKKRSADRISIRTYPWNFRRWCRRYAADFTAVGAAITLLLGPVLAEFSPLV